MPASAAGGAEAALLGKGRYKVWALAAIALLALWSMSAASVSLRWSSSGDLASIYGDMDVPLADDLDSLVRTHAPFYLCPPASLGPRERSLSGACCFLVRFVIYYCTA
jgi:hypothetical protein